MINTTETLLRELESQLLAIKKHNYHFRQACALSANAAGEAIMKLKELVLSRDFASQQEEIRFFKFLKPAFMAWLFYHRSLHKMEMEKPSGDSQVLTSYYRERLHELWLYKMKNQHISYYISCDDNRFDQLFFTRKGSNPSVDGYINPFYFEAEPRFTTHYDYKVARLLANEKLEQHLVNCLHELENNTGTAKAEVKQKPVSPWSGTKAELVELAYALHAAGVLYNGVDLTQTIAFIEENFGVDLGQYHRTFQELRSRKMERTKFTDKMKTALIAKMDAADEKEDRKRKVQHK